MQLLIDVLNEGRRLYYEERLSLRDVVTKLLPIEVGPNDLELLVATGLKQLLRKTLIDERRGDVPVGEGLRPVLAFRPQIGETGREYYKLFSTLYETVTGPKPLIEFTEQDCADRVAVESAVIEGGERRRSWFLSAATMLKTAKVATVGELPPATLTALEQKARELFERVRGSEEAS